MEISLISVISVSEQMTLVFIIIQAFFNNPVNVNKQ